MRTISKYISFALMAFAVVACHTNDIDNPDNPDNPNPPQISDNVTFTASIKQTRVEYTPNDDKLDQCWKPNDVIYGFYGEGSGSKIILQVTDVDSNGYAKLEPLYDTGPDFVAALKESVKNGEDLTIGLIYTGKTNINKSYGNDIYVYFMSQGTGQIPACMRCYDYDASNTDEDGNTIVEFIFDNDCAILEIKGITGAKEEADLPEGEKTELKSVTVSNTTTTLQYSYDGGISRVINSDYMGDTYVEPESLYIDSNGNIVDSNGNSKSVMIAVVPNDFKKDINVIAEISGGKTFGSSYNTAFAAGTCYVIRQKDVVAKTEDGLYFTSVSGAFRRAAYLNEHSDLLNGKTNTVTLVKDYIDGLNEDVDHTKPDSSPEIVINYPVTLDLNGCSLNLNYLEDDVNCKPLGDKYYGGGFNVVGITGRLTIIDGSDDWGSINSYDDVPIITNSGTVNVQAGYLYNYNQNVINSTGTLNVSAGNLYSAQTTICLSGTEASGAITGGAIWNDNVSSIEAIQVLGGAECTISGGVIYSLGEQACTIGCRSTDEGDPVLTVKWPEESDDSSYEPIIYSAGEYSTTLPISAYMNGDNGADIIIKGGYLISNNSYGAFYSDNEGANLNLDITDTDFNFGGFYSNMSGICMDGSDISNKSYDLSVNGGVGLPKKEEGDQKYGAIPQDNSSLISAIIDILEDETEEEVEIDDLFLIHAVTSISE